MSLFASQRHVRSRIDDVNDRAHRAMNSASDAVDHARYAARPAVADVQSLLRSLENAIHTLTDEGSAEASRARRTLHARADQLRQAANDRAHQARERMDWALDRTEETIARRRSSQWVSPWRLARRSGWSWRWPAAAAGATPAR
ncbi:DUF883 family protein [Cupriavidus basilensis]